MPAPLELSRDGDVFVLRMGRVENRMAPAFLEAFHAALDEVEASDGPAALVSVGRGRFYSNGLDLAALGALSPEAIRDFMRDFHRLFGRLLGLDVLTVAALNGHAFAGGAMLALAHDFRVMRRDRGFFCLPEIDMASGQPLTPGLFALIGARLDRHVFHDLLLTGRRVPAEEAVAAKVVHEAADEAQVLPRAVEIARGLAGKDRPTVAALKRGLHADAIATLVT